MKEIIIANGIQYECENVTTSENSISFSPNEGDLETLKEEFKQVTELEVADEEGHVYGSYEHLSLASVAIGIEGEEEVITVTMHIASDVEVRLENLEETQIEQDDLIAGIIFGE